MTGENALRNAELSVRVDSGSPASIATDRGGVDRLSEGQKQIARRCAMLSVVKPVVRIATVDVAVVGE